MSSDLSITGEVVVTSEKAEAAFTRVEAAAQGMANGVANSATQASQAVDKIGDGAGQTAEQWTRAESKMYASIKRSTRELELLGKTASQKFEFNIADKGLDPTKFEGILQKLRETEALALRAQTAASGSLDKMGVSAAQTAAAMRQVPAQFTDIITSLQGGQKPMTVLLQQGGQLKDMFGGAGNAAKAMGTYVGELITPFNAAAAAAAAVGYAAYKGSEEVKAFELALDLSGNASGVTTEQLRSLAKTTLASAESLAMFARAGVSGASDLQQFSEAAVRFEKYTGIAVKESVAAWKSLGDDPVKSALKLNESVSFLTTTIYKQTKALEDQGKALEAANYVQEQYRLAQQRIADGAESKLSSVSYGWDQIAASIGKAYKALKDFTNGDSTESRIAASKATIASAQKGLQGAQERGETGRVEQYQKILEIENKRLAMLQAGLSVEKGTSVEKSEQDKRLEAQVALDREHDKFLSKSLVMEREIAKVREDAKNANKGLQAIVDYGGAGADAARKTLAENQKKLAASEAGIREQYAGEGPRTALDAIIRQYEDQQTVITQAEQRAAKTLAARHAAQLVDDAAFYAKKRDLALQSNAEQQALIQGEIAAVARSGIKSGDKTKEIERYNGELSKLRQQALGIESDYADGLIAIAAKERKIQDDYITSLGKAGASESKRLDAAIAAQREYNATIGMSKEQIEYYKKSIQDAEVVELEAQYNAINAMLEKNQALLDYGDTLGLIGGKAREIYEEERKNLQDQIAKRKILAADTAKGAAKESAVAAAKEVAEEWKRGWTETDRIAREAFTSWAEGGTNAADAIGKALKKALLAAIYEATVKPVVFEIYASVIGTAPGGNTAAGVPGLSGGSMGSPLSWLTNFQGSSTTAIERIGERLINTSSESLNKAGSYLLNNSTQIGKFINNAGNVLAAVNVIDLWSKGQRGAAVGAGLGQYFGGPIGSWIGQTIGSKFDYTVDDKGSALVANVGTKGVVGDVASRHDYVQHGGWLGGGTTNNSDWSKADDGYKTYINDTVISVAAATKTYAAALGLPVDAIDGFSKQIEASIAGLDPAGQKAAIDKAVSSFLDEMVTSAYGTSMTGLAKGGETSGQTLQRLATDLTGVNAMFATLHQTLLPVGIAGATAAAGLADAFGGLDKMQASVGTYYERAYSEAEKAANSVRTLQDAFGALGLAVPKTEAEFKSLVDGIDRTTESGRTLYAAVINLAPAFYQASESARTAASNMLSAVQNWGSSADVRAYQAQILQKNLADAGLSLSMDQIMGATQDTALAYYKSLDPTSKQAQALLKYQQDIFNFVGGVKTAGAAAAGGYSSGGGGYSGGGSVDYSGATAAQSIAQAWQSITDSIWDEVKRIRNLLAGTGPEAYAAAQAKFAIANAQARAGDQEAAKSLPEVSRMLQELAQQNTQSALELRLLQGKSAAALSETANILALKFGLSVPKFAAGTNYTQEGLAYLHEGEAVVPKAYNPAAGAQLGRSTDLIDAVRTLAGRLDVIEANTRASAQFGGAISRALQKVMPDGDAIETRTAAA